MQPTVAFPGSRLPRLGAVRAVAYRVTGALAGIALVVAALLDATGAGALGGNLAGRHELPSDRTPPAVAARVRPVQRDEPGRAQEPRRLGGIPTGTGMWTWEPEHTEGGNAAAIVRRATAAGLTHIYVRTGSSWQGFHGGPFLDALLPAAHRAGLRVYGWDFPSMENVSRDLWRAQRAIRYRAPGGHRIDGFVADIETSAEGTDLGGAAAYGRHLRSRVGRDEVLIACVPNPTEHNRAIFPYAAVVEPYDAVAPMVYWLNRQPDTDVTAALDHLRPLGKPLLPIGQAYDGGPEGGRPGTPPREEIVRFIDAARAGKARAISFWSWQHASPEIWQAISDVKL